MSHWVHVQLSLSWKYRLYRLSSSFDVKCTNFWHITIPYSWVCLGMTHNIVIAGNKYSVSKTPISLRLFFQMGMRLSITWKVEWPVFQTQPHSQHRMTPWLHTNPEGLGIKVGKLSCVVHSGGEGANNPLYNKEQAVLGWRSLLMLQCNTICFELLDRHSD